MTHLVTVDRTATERINLGPAQAGRVGACNTAAIVATVRPGGGGGQGGKGESRGIL